MLTPHMVLPLALLFFAAGGVAFLAAIPVRWLAVRTGCIDRPDKRKLHEWNTPRLGGLAIVLGFSLPLAIALFDPRVLLLVEKNINYLWAVLASGATIIALGVYDDFVGSNAPKKFTFQTIAALAVVALGFHFDTVYIPGIGNTDLGWFGIVVTILWIVGVINAVNFIDGMDGLATIVSLTTAAAFAIIAVIRGDVFTLVIMTALAGALAGFLPWNRYPARIFMGDSGSLFIGLILATCSVARYSKAPTALIVGGPILALALPVVDTLLVMRGRLFLADSTFRTRLRRMFNADRTHIHHVLIRRYGSQSRAIAAIWSMTLLFGVAAVLTVMPGIKLYGYLLGLLTFLLMLAVRSAVEWPPHPLRRKTDSPESHLGLR